MRSRTSYPARRYRAFTHQNVEGIPQLFRLPREELDTLRAVAAVLPFRVNEYVLENLIDWDSIPDDPIYQLTFPQRGMLPEEDFDRMLDLVRQGASEGEKEKAVREIQMRLNPQPSGQRDLNVPQVNGLSIPGMQHKYRDTVLFFPSQGQTCHAYCSYCFRWAQFVGIDGLKFASREAGTLAAYVAEHREVRSVLITGGDPMIMKTNVLRRYIEPLLDIESVESIRIGTKAVSYWPYRFVSNGDGDDLMRLFDEVVQAGKHLAIMAHYTHPRELDPPVAQDALRRILSTGAVVRCQAPLIRRVNDDPKVWARLWRLQCRLGAIPYYMFVERDTGAKKYFELPLGEVYGIYREAFVRVGGLARTVRGPVMSAAPGKVKINGITEIAGERVFVLEFLRARNRDWVGRPFFARYDPRATWLHHLRPAFGKESFFFENGVQGPRELRGLLPERAAEDRTRWGQRPVTHTDGGRVLFRDPCLDPGDHWG